MERSPIFPVHKKGINPADFLRNYLCLYYQQCLGEAASHNLYLDCNNCRHKGTHVDFLMMDLYPFEGTPSPK